MLYYVVSEQDEFVMANKYTPKFEQYKVCLYYSHFRKLFLIENHLSETNKYILVNNKRDFRKFTFVKGTYVKFNNAQTYIATEHGMIPYRENVVIVDTKF